jgi:hypothetical protein
VKGDWILENDTTIFPQSLKELGQSPLRIQDGPGGRIKSWEQLSGDFMVEGWCKYVSTYIMAVD